MIKNDPENYITVGMAQEQRRQERLSASPAGVVKPLEWRTFCSRSGNCEAKTVMGDYVLQFEGLGFDASWKLYLPHNYYSTGVCYHTLEAAKSAAFADYSARIMSAIEPAGVTMTMQPLGEEFQAAIGDREGLYEPAGVGVETEAKHPIVAASRVYEVLKKYRDQGRFDWDYIGYICRDVAALTKEATDV